jgi:hypothetical protein
MPVALKIHSSRRRFTAMLNLSEAHFMSLAVFERLKGATPEAGLAELGIELPAGIR